MVIQCGTLTGGGDAWEEVAVQHVRRAGLGIGMTILSAGSDIHWISDPLGMGSGTKFDPWVLPVSDPILLRVGYEFGFLPAGTRQIYENSDFRFLTYQYAS